MGLTTFALKNPFAVLAMSVGLCLLGLAMVPAMPIDILPDFGKPVIVSFFSYPGLPTVEMEKSVTSRVERALTLAGRIEHQESRTVSGATVIKVVFQPGTNPSSAMNDIVNLEASDMFHLPPGIEWPFTLRSEPANLPVVLAAISGEGLSETELYKIGYYAVRNKMGGLRGVQIPHPFGGKFRQMMVYVNPGRMRSVGVSAADVARALGDSNLVLAAGSVRLGDLEYQVHPINTLPTVEEIEAVPIAVRDGRTIFIRDVGYASDDAALQYNIVRVNGKRSVYCPLLREPGENTIAVVDRIYEGIATEIPLMKEREEIPAATEVTLVSDQSNYIRNAMRNLFYQVALGALLVAVVVLVFLRRLVPTLAIVGTIVLSMLVGGLAFSFTGHTINVMTLGGVALAIGTVVDAGIVVVENVIRHQRMGKTPLESARDGSAEVAMPILAGTVTTLAVFIPAIFLTGMIQSLFAPLSVAAVSTIGASYFIAMTVVPAFCAAFVRNPRAHAPRGNARPDAPRHEPGDTTQSVGASVPTQSVGTRYDDDREITEHRGLYGRLLAGAITARFVVVIAVVVGVAATGLLLPFVGTELFPDVDAGTLEIRVKTLPGTRLEETEKVVARIEDAIRGEIPTGEIETIISNIGLPVGKGAGFSTILSSNSGPDTAYVIVNLKTSGRAASTADYVRRLRGLFAERFPREQFLFVRGGIVNMALNEGVPTPISVQVSAGSLEKCRSEAELVVRALRDVPGAVDVQIAQALDYPQLDIKVDRTRAKHLGLDQRQVAENVLAALGSSVAYAPTIWIDPTGTDFFMGVQYESNEIDSLDEIRNIPLSLETPDGPTTIPLGQIAEIRRVNIPGEVAHYNIARVNDVHVNVDGRDVGSVAADVERALAALPIESGVTRVIRGPVETMKSGGRMLGVGLAVAALLVYLVMLAQFKSFVDPLIIMLSVPLGLSGVVVVLFLTGTTLNIQSLMGTLMMIGVVVNNAILLVEFANQLRERGHSTRDAAIAAARIRLRPILMTSLTLVASMLPLCFPIAPGNEAMIPLARALVGGMLASTLLTLFLVPCVYVMVKPTEDATA